MEAEYLSIQLYIFRQTKKANTKIIIADIEKIRPKNSKTPVMLLLDFSNIKNKNLPDPYYTNDFEGVAKMIEIACDNLLVQYFNS